MQGSIPLQLQRLSVENAPRPIITAIELSKTRCIGCLGKVDNVLYMEVELLYLDFFVTIYHRAAYAATRPQIYK